MSLPVLTISPEVQTALSSNQGIVALESTIITHGMPYPQNRDTAMGVEQAVRDSGAIPATIAILDGQIMVGLDEEQLETLARSSNAMKLSRADLAMALARKAMGSTTVAATMIIAHLAGIKVFATGGIGGVHQGAELSFDVSADLQELSRTPVSVICAGAKAILDIPKTLEVLETLGVPVLAYGQDEVPAFWSRSSGLAAPLRADKVSEIVDFLQARDSLQISGGVLVTNPVPAEAEIPQAEMQTFIAQAIEESQAAGISGKAVTPWLLGRIVEITEGRSLVTNQALIINNARLAAELAVALSQR
ncbi:pseudouridine-5'-phosphate glycosidase [Granulosicoccus sp. 3-233]|uniref:pseudouridine-5'-phosphate glycosidase n=1 Tax=Granulosicoccus sp. 3-233 TaxID=3417969 RepID=UPI003D34F5C7